jgi:hypothetical protein
MLPHKDGLVLNELRGLDRSLHCACPESSRDRLAIRISLQLKEEVVNMEQGREH